MEGGYRDLCNRCFNEEVAEIGGIDFSHVQFEALDISDAAGDPASLSLRGETAWG